MWMSGPNHASVTLRLIAYGREFPHLKSNSVLIDEGGDVVLVDIGGLDDAGALARSLAKEGIKPGDVDGVFFTHLHFDHYAEASVLPRAQVAVHWREWEHWQRLCRTPPEQREGVLRRQYAALHEVYVRFILRDLPRMAAELANLGRDRGRLRLVQDGDMLSPHVRVVATPGHTAGHASLRIEGPRGIWIAGDAVISLRAWQQGLGGPAARLMADPLAQQTTLATIARYRGGLIPGHGDPFDMDTGELLSLTEGWEA